MSLNPDWNLIVLRDVCWAELEKRQAECVAAVRENTQRAFLLLSEPRATFTGGRSANESGLQWDQTRRQQEGVDVQTVDRGGRWTFHGPGQILLYPIVSLPALGLHKRDVVPFLDALRGGVMDFLRDVGVAGAAAPENSCDKPFGVYVGDRKLVSFGISLHEGICAHGLALYAEPQTRFFEGIVPCGVPNQKVTSLVELGLRLDWEEAATRVAAAVKKRFSFDDVDGDPRNW